MDIRIYNRQAWDREVERGNRWTVPVSAQVIARARAGSWHIVLTPTVPVPANWFPPLDDLDVLCLASGGGQQGPILAAAGACVTVLDNSPRQLEQDRRVADRDGLSIATVEADMRDLSPLGAARFDLIVHPVSNVFVPDVRPVWREAFRVLRPGGALLAGFVNPVNYIFDHERLIDDDALEVRFAIPYADIVDLDDETRRRYLHRGWPLEFGHSLADQIGGQLDAGFVIAGFYEDKDSESRLGEVLPTFAATRAIKPAGA